MIRNYLLIGFRKLMRNKTFSFINISGLAIGIATCLIIMLFVSHELSYDSFNTKAERIVRVAFKGSINGTSLNEASVMPPVAQTIKNDFPEIEEATRFKYYGKPTLVIGDKIFREESFAFADSNFFSVFTVPLLKGDPKTALLQPNTIVISQPTANKYFGTENPIGKTILLKDQNVNFTVSGVFEKIPENAHFHFELLAAMSGLPDARSDTWMESGFFTFLVLNTGTNYKNLEAKLPAFVEKHMSTEFSKAFGMSLEQFRKKGNNIEFYLQPITSIHLHSEATNELEAGGNVQYVYIFAAIAIFMLIIACINFMNLSTAGGSKRAREVGIRKVMGSGKLSLIAQFLVESTLMSLLSLVIAIILVGLALPVFNQLAEKDLKFSADSLLTILPWLILLGLSIGLLAGSYPAFYLSSFNPISVLKGKLATAKKGPGLRSVLVVFQFCISIILIVGTTVVYQQLKFIQEINLGYNKDQVLIISDTWKLGQQEASFRQQLLQDPRIIKASSSGYLPAGPSNGNNFFLAGDDNNQQYTKTLRYDVDPEYISTMGMEIVKGRNFSSEFGTDSVGIILNEAATRQFGWEKDPLIHSLINADNSGNKTSYRVIGVVKDFHFKSLHETITPLVMVMSKNAGTLILKINTKDIAGILTSVRNQWTSFSTGQPLNYSFLDDRYDQTYNSEKKTGMLLGIFAGLTILIACLGLFGLTIFTAEQRTREIGIRKVLGASVTGIIELLSREYVKLVVIAFLFAAPIGWYVMHKWLESFAYKIDIKWVVFAVAGGIALLITIITMSFQSIKAAVANPVKALRSE